MVSKEPSEYFGSLTQSPQGLLVSSLPVPEIPPLPCPHLHSRLPFSLTEDSTTLTEAFAVPLCQRTASQLSHPCTGARKPSRRSTSVESDDLSLPELLRRPPDRTRVRVSTRRLAVRHAGAPASLFESPGKVWEGTEEDIKRRISFRRESKRRWGTVA
jgi:hypothetical protein